MTHAEQLQQAKDALVEAAMNVGMAGEPGPWSAFYNARIAYRALLAATCPACSGRGEQTFVGDWRAPYVPCPAKCDNGRKRDE